jgi:hypothetical protein
VSSRIFVDVVEWFWFRGQDRVHHTELIPYGVLHHYPRNVALADIDTLRTQPFEAPNLCVLGCVHRADIEMQPVLVQLLV